MHAYVERVSKLDKDGVVASSVKSFSKKNSSHALEENEEINASTDKINRSQRIEQISEIDSENEFSYINEEEKKYVTEPNHPFDEPIKMAMIHSKRLNTSQVI
jgi:hypothetical protein